MELKVDLSSSAVKVVAMFFIIVVMYLVVILFLRNKSCSECSKLKPAKQSDEKPRKIIKKRKNSK